MGFKTAEQTGVGFVHRVGSFSANRFMGFGVFAG
jgi:hypothetical protein